MELEDMPNLRMFGGRKAEPLNGDKQKREIAIKKWLKDNFGIFLNWGCMYGTNIVTTTFYLMVIGINIILGVITIIVARHDLETFSESIHITIIITMCFTTVIIFNIHRKAQDFIYCFLGNGVFDYHDSMDPESQSEIKLIKEKSTIRKILVTRILGGGVIFAASIIALRPLINLLRGQNNYQNDDGINRYMPIKWWYPFDTTNKISNAVCFLMQYTLISFVPGPVLGSVIMFLCTSEELCVQLKILRYSLRNFERRAKYVAKLHSSSDSIQHVTFQESIQICLKNSIRHHQVIIKIHGNFKELFYFKLFWLVLGGSLLLCLGAYLLFDESVPIEVKILYFIMTVSELFLILIYCWYGEEMESLSQSLGEELYNSNWLGYSKEIKPYALILQSYSISAPMQITAGGFQQFNLKYYNDVLSAAYSYFNVLNAVK